MNMKNSGMIDIVIEKEKVKGENVFIAWSHDVNVFAEGKTIEKAIKKFLDGAKFHFENFSEDRTFLVKKIRKI